MLSVEAPRAFNDPGFVHEIRCDGRCLLASSDGATVELKTRNGANATKWSKWFPEIRSSLVDLPGGRHVFDGELVRLG